MDMSESPVLIFLVALEGLHGVVGFQGHKVLRPEAACGNSILASKQGDCSLPDCRTAAFQARSTAGLAAWWLIGGMYGAELYGS